MKIKNLLLFVAASFAISATAQDLVVPQGPDMSKAGSKTTFKKNAGGDNWFIQLGGGVSILDKDENGDADFADRLNFAPSFSVGKWFSPYFAVRAQVIGGPLKNFRKNASIQDDFTYVGGHLDFMLDLVNLWGPYRADRGFHFAPWVGLGYANRFKETTNGIDIPRSETPTLNFGVLTSFRLGKRVDLNIEPQFLLAQEHFNRVQMHHTTDIIYQLQAGLTFKLGKTDFEVVDPMDYALLNDLNSQINALRAENAELSKRPESCPDCPEVAPEVINNYVDNVVFFRLNSSRIDRNQEINIFNTAEFVKENKTAIKVIGYADEKTGSSSYNLKLSEKRARNVAKQLIEKYGVPSDMISIEWKGSDEQVYSQNAWNRVVIMRAE